MCELLALVEGEFLVLDGFLDGESGPLVNFEVEVSGVGSERFRVNGCETDFSLMLLSQGLEGLS